MEVDQHGSGAQPAGSGLSPGGNGGEATLFAGAEMVVAAAASVEIMKMMRILSLGVSNQNHHQGTSINI
eukprot:4341496-Karenia_brevis.AAC.1